MSSKVPAPPVKKGNISIKPPKPKLPASRPPIIINKND